MRYLLLINHSDLTTQPEVLLSFHPHIHDDFMVIEVAFPTLIKCFHLIHVIGVLIGFEFASLI